MRIWHQSFTDLTRVPDYRDTLRRHAAAVLEPDVEVTVHGLRPGTYPDGVAPIHAIRYRWVEFLNEAQVCEAAMAAERAGYDAFALGCFHDPGLRQARSLVSIPCAGLSESCLLTACSLAAKVSLVTITARQARQHAEMVDHYGLAARVASIRPLEPEVDEFMMQATPAAQAAIVAAFEASARASAADGAELVIPGEGVLNEFLYARGIRQVDDVPVMDALGVLFRHTAYLAGLQQRLGQGVSRRHSYARPPAELVGHARRFLPRAPMAEDEFSG